jgi:hypothetical protein
MSNSGRRPNECKCLRPLLHARPSIRGYCTQARKATHDAIMAYATQVAGTDLDLDHDLESARIKHLVRTRRTRR